MNRKVEDLKVVSTAVIRFIAGITCFLNGDPVIDFIMWRLKRECSGDVVLQIDECPHYEVCSAPMCPLDPNLMKSNYLKGEGVCFYVREYVKKNSKHTTLTLDGIDKEIMDAVPHTIALMKMIGKRNFLLPLNKAAQSKSKRSTNNLKTKNSEKAEEDLS